MCALKSIRLGLSKAQLHMENFLVLMSAYNRAVINAADKCQMNPVLWWWMTNLEPLVIKFSICIGMESWVHIREFKKTGSSGLWHWILCVLCSEQNAQCDLNTLYYQYILTESSLKFPRCSAPERKSKQRELWALFFICTAQDNRTIPVSNKLNFHMESNQLAHQKKIYYATSN